MQHSFIECEVEECEACAIGGAEGVRVGGADEDQVAGGEADALVVDQVEAPAAFDPEGFGEVVVVRRAGDGGGEGGAGEVEPSAGGNEVAHPQVNGHINRV